jgi:hypothetical protein
MKKFIGGLALLALASGAQGAIVVYTTLANWQAAVGPADIAEDFSGFTVDTDFKPAAVAINGGTIGQVGTNTAAFRNLIDVPPLAFTDNNGTTHASSFTNFDEPTFPKINVELVFTTPVSAYGWQTWGAASGEMVDVDVVDTGGTVLATIQLANGLGDFRGFNATAGEQIGKLVFRSRNLTLGQGGEGFGLDNLIGKTAEAGCYPDCDGDGKLTIDDFICFQTFFALSDPYADCDGDGALTIDDFICFQTFFAIGC